MGVQKCFGMCLVWVACLLLAMAAEAEAQSYDYGSNNSAQTTSSHTMLLKLLGFVVSFLVLKEMV